VKYTLIGADGAPYRSSRPGSLGGHRRNHGYGRLDCPAALRWIARGHYVRHRVFFADEATAIAAGYRPCASCLPKRYAAWRSGAGWPDGLGAEWADLGRAPGALGYLSARAIPGIEQVDGSAYRRTIELDHGPALIELDLRDGAARFRMLAGDSRDAAEARARARRLLGLDVPIDEPRAALGCDPLLGPLIAARPDLRVPGTVDGTELAVRAIVNQQVSLAAAATVLGRLAEEHGRALRHWPLRLFPAADVLAAIDPSTLPMPRARARALVTMCAAGLDLRFGADPAEARAGLLAIPGVGDWTASYIALRVLGDPDAFLPTDLGIKRALAGLGCATDQRSVTALAERWRPWRSYAAQVLWAGDSEQ
jgi:AraC family transcriptional regulator of adaptative response / DNA-3-methyladenine glycosylase II